MASSATAISDPNTLLDHLGLIVKYEWDRNGNKGVWEVDHDAPAFFNRDHLKMMGFSEEFIRGSEEGGTMEDWTILDMIDMSPNPYKVFADNPSTQLRGLDLQNMGFPFDFATKDFDKIPGVDGNDEEDSNDEDGEKDVNWPQMSVNHPLRCDVAAKKHVAELGPPYLVNGKPLPHPKYTWKWQTTPLVAPELAKDSEEYERDQMERLYAKGPCFYLCQSAEEKEVNSTENNRKRSHESSDDEEEEMPISFKKPKNVRGKPGRLASRTIRGQKNKEKQSGQASGSKQTGKAGQKSSIDKAEVPARAPGVMEEDFGEIPDGFSLIIPAKNFPKPLKWPEKAKEEAHWIHINRLRRVLEKHGASWNLTEKQSLVDILPWVKDVKLTTAVTAISNHHLHKLWTTSKSFMIGYGLVVIYGYEKVKASNTGKAIHQEYGWTPDVDTTPTKKQLKDRQTAPSGGGSIDLDGPDFQAAVFRALDQREESGKITRKEVDNLTAMAKGQESRSTDVATRLKAIENKTSELSQLAATHKHEVEQLTTSSDKSKTGLNRLDRLTTKLDGRVDQLSSSLSEGMVESFKSLNRALLSSEQGRMNEQNEILGKMIAQVASIETLKKKMEEEMSRSKESYEEELAKLRMQCRDMGGGGGAD